MSDCIAGDEEVARRVYNVYCDESCHLEHDVSSVMGFGAMSIESSSTRALAREIRDLKEKAAFHVTGSWEHDRYMRKYRTQKKGTGC